MKDMDKIEVNKALAVFDRIIEKGEKEGDVFVLNGLVAEPSFDGYSVTIKDEKVALHIHFHNQFNVEYDSRKDFDEFMLKLERAYQAD